MHELTFSCYPRLPLLTNDEWRDEFCTAINRAVDRHSFRLLAFVFLPELVHLIVHPGLESSPVSDLLRAIKRSFSYRIKQRLIASGGPLLNRLAIRQRPGVMTFRSWQEGPGYDHDLTQPSVILAVID